MNILTKNQNGFTLIELMIALVIFAVGILGVATMQITSIQGNSKANRITEASNLVTDRIEMFLSLDYSHPDLDDDGGGFAGIPGLGDVTVATADGSDTSNPNYQIFWNVYEPPLPIPNPDNIPKSKTIRVIVDPSGNGPNVSMDIIKVE